MRGPLLYRGKSKAIFAAEHPGEVLVEFLDDATAFNGKKHALIDGKGAINCAISAHLFALVGAAGVAHHLIRVEGPALMRCVAVRVVPVEVVVRNRVAGSLARRYGRTEGEPLAEPLVELFVKSDALDDPLINDDAAVALGFATANELAFMRGSALRVNELLRAFWAELGVELVDMKLEYGRADDGRLLLADEITPDGARLWETGTGRKLDKDVFRRDLGDLSETYRALSARVFPASR